MNNLLITGGCGFIGANFIHYLLEESGYSGQIINVDGGHGLRRGPDMSAMLEPVFGPDGLRGVV